MESASKCDKYFAQFLYAVITVAKEEIDRDVLFMTQKFFEVVVNSLLCFWSGLPPTTANCNIRQIILFHPVIFLLQKSTELGNICQIDSSNNQRLNIIRCFHFFLRDDDKNLISIFKLELLEFLPILHKLS